MRHNFGAPLGVGSARGGGGGVCCNVDRTRECQGTVNFTISIKMWGLEGIRWVLKCDFVMLVVYEVGRKAIWAIL